MNEVEMKAVMLIVQLLSWMIVIGFVQLIALLLILWNVYKE